MSLPVHLADGLAGLRPGTGVVLEGEEAHHAVAVRRMRAGERLMLTDGRGVRVLAEVTGTGKRRLEAVALEVEELAEPGPRVSVVQALPKGDRGERAVEMLTEIGCAQVIPWAAERCVAVWRGERVGKGVARWRTTAREAAKQARRAWFPEVTDLHRTDQLRARVAAADLAIVLHEEAEQPLASVSVPRRGELLVVVGPEGGLSEAEVAGLVDAGAIEVRLGVEVLRTSTAGVAAVAALLARTSRWG